MIQTPASTSGLTLDILRSAGTLSRTDLAERTGLTAATMTNVVRRLMDAGLVHDAGRLQQGRGQPRRMLALSPTAWYAVGVQLDRTTTTVVVVDFTGAQVTHVGLRGTGSRGPEDSVRAVVAHVRDLIASANIPRERILGLGLATHGPQDRERGMLLTSEPTPDWLEYPLSSALSSQLGLPVLLENDATAAAIGVQRVGVLPTDTFGLIYLANGVGGAVVVGGEPYRGRASNAVEIGHLPLTGGGRPCVCGNVGCVQAEGGPAATVEQALTDASLVERLALVGSGDDILADFERLARASRAGDESAIALLARSGAQIGEAAVALVNLFDLDTVVLSGPALRTAGSLYLPLVDDALQKRWLSRTLARPQVLITDNLDTAAATGAALEVLRSTPIDR